MIYVMILKYLCLVLFYGFANFLPNSYIPVIGTISNKIRLFLCRRIFRKMGKVSTINRCVNFGKGMDIEIGNYSGIGEGAIIPPNTKIGNFVMIAPYLYIVGGNHKFDRIDMPMCFQGSEQNKVTIMEDDVWIGARVIIMPECHIGKGSIIAAGAVVTKNIGEYEIWGGVPARLLKKRI